MLHLSLIHHPIGNVALKLGPTTIQIVEAIVETQQQFKYFGTFRCIVLVT